MTKAEKKLQVANIRLLAARQRTMAAGYRRQAAHPIYPGQDLICLAKADEIAALAALTEAEADLLDENIPIRGNKRPKNSQGEGTGKKGEEL